MPVWKPIIALPLTVWCNAQANMLDPIARKLIDKPLDALANRISRKISANSITIMGFFIGILSFVAIIKGQFTLALVFLALNRLCDGLDGAVARRQTPSDLGAYLDILADFILWALLPLGFVFYAPQNAFAAALLLASFAMSMSAFLAFAMMAEKRGLSTEAQGKKGIYYLSGLAEGTETIAFFALVMIRPDWFIPAALFFAGLVFLSVIGRLIVSVKVLREG